MCTEQSLFHQGTDNPKASSSLIRAINLGLEVIDTYEILDTDLLISCCLSLDVFVSPTKISGGYGYLSHACEKGI